MVGTLPGLSSIKQVVLWCTSSMVLILQLYLYLWVEEDNVGHSFLSTEQPETCKYTIQMQIRRYLSGSSGNSSHPML